MQMLQLLHLLIQQQQVKLQKMHQHHQHQPQLLHQHLQQLLHLLQQLLTAGAQIASTQRSGPTATALWGSATAGLAPAALHGPRVAAAKSEGKLAAGASLGSREAPMVSLHGAPGCDGLTANARRPAT